MSGDRGVQASEILRRARRRLASAERWMQAAPIPPEAEHQRATGDCPMCLSAALLFETTGDPIDTPISGSDADPWVFVWRAIFGGAQSREDYSDPEPVLTAIYEWNDDANRTHADVLWALDSAINLAEHHERRH